MSACRCSHTDEEHFGYTMGYACIECDCREFMAASILAPAIPEGAPPAANDLTKACPSCAAPAWRPCAPDCPTRRPSVIGSEPTLPDDIKQMLVTLYDTTVAEAVSENASPEMLRAEQYKAYRAVKMWILSLESENARLTRELAAMRQAGGIVRGQLAAYREVGERARAVAHRDDYLTREFWWVSGVLLDELAAALASLPPTGTEK
jgi:hypothetical protein